MVAAEQKARTVYDNILRLTDDDDVRQPIKFLRAREIVHFQRFGEPNRLIESELEKYKFHKNREADNKRRFSILIIYSKYRANSNFIPVFQRHNSVKSIIALTVFDKIAHSHKLKPFVWIKFKYAFFYQAVSIFKF